MLGPKKIEARAMEAKDCQRACLEAMTPQEQCDLEALHEGHKDFFHPETDNMYDVTNILDRLKTIDLSHGGGKLHDLTRDLFSDMKNM
ncbi:hypothetical protein PISMIDRAFT_16864 [Pisolithus microcarpus 441]|uniref:Uncharacterized protein n=1 Tax=Pisolithus microcarpus 441 TaxID=765257 RepID=A0A0C9YEJ0_9AGAM|nr:hypothetical protein PISMIDRAFT_16864 [Pisolithus microcarpus 441]